jgi:hypothetical protein
MPLELSLPRLRSAHFTPSVGLNTPGLMSLLHSWAVPTHNAISWLRPRVLLTRPITFALAWYDFPSDLNSAGPLLLNDLDLQVRP